MGRSTSLILGKKTPQWGKTPPAPPDSLQPAQAKHQKLPRPLICQGNLRICLTIISQKGLSHGLEAQAHTRIRM